MRCQAVKHHPHEPSHIQPCMDANGNVHELGSTTARRVSASRLENPARMSRLEPNGRSLVYSHPRNSTIDDPRYASPCTSIRDARGVSAISATCCSPWHRQNKVECHSVAAQGRCHGLATQVLLTSVRGAERWQQDQRDRQMPQAARWLAFRAIRGCCH